MLLAETTTQSSLMTQRDDGGVEGVIASDRGFESKAVDMSSSRRKSNVLGQLCDYHRATLGMRSEVSVAAYRGYV